MDLHIIYVVSTPAYHKQDLYKLGRYGGTQKQLLSRYQTGTPDPVMILFCYPTRNSQFDENRLKKLLASYRLQGEWFKVPLYKMQKVLANYFENQAPEYVTYKQKFSSEYPIAKSRGQDSKYVTDWLKYFCEKHQDDAAIYTQKIFDLISQLNDTSRTTSDGTGFISPEPHRSVNSTPHSLIGPNDRVIISLDPVSYGNLIALIEK